MKKLSKKDIYNYLSLADGVKFQLDPRIKPLVDVLNKFPGVVTFASCEGHGVELDGQYGLYVAFVCRNLKSLETIVKSLCRHTKTSQRVSGWEICLGDAVHPVFGEVTYRLECNPEAISINDLYKAIETLTYRLRKAI